METALSLLADFWESLLRAANWVGNWSGDRWVAVTAVVVAGLAGIGTFWQAAEARGAKNLARQALGDSSRSADAAEAAVVAAQEAAVQAQRVADIEAGRDHVERRRAIANRFEIRNGQRIANLTNSGQQVLHIKAVAIYADGGRSLRADDVELHPGGAIEVPLGRVRDQFDRLEILVDGECSCSNAESPDSHWFVKVDIPALA